MTCAPDAFNSGDGLVVLAPGRILQRPLRAALQWVTQPPSTTIV